MRQHLDLVDGFLGQQRRERLGAATTAKAAAIRARERESGRPPIAIPSWASAKQVAAVRAILADLAARERSMSKVERGWERLPLHKAPPGTAAVGILVGRRTVFLAVDGAGALRLVGGDAWSVGSIVSVSEAAACAASR